MYCIFLFQGKLNLLTDNSPDYWGYTGYRDRWHTDLIDMDHRHQTNRLYEEVVSHALKPENEDITAVSKIYSKIS